jgi:hypothetical protein
MLDLFLKSWKPLKLGRFRSERKPMLDVFFKIEKTIEFGLLSQWKKANVGLVSEIMKLLKLGCFRNEQKPMLDMLFEMVETIEFGLLS